MEKINRRALLIGALSPPQINDVEEAIKVIPNYDAKLEIICEGYDELVVGDLVTIKVTLNRSNLPEGMEVGMGYTNSNIDLYEEKVCVMLTKNDKIIHEQLVRLLKFNLYKIII